MHLSEYFITATETRTEGPPQTLQVPPSWTLQLQRCEKCLFCSSNMAAAWTPFCQGLVRAVFSTDFLLSPLPSTTGSILRPMLGKQRASPGVKEITTAPSSPARKRLALPYRWDEMLRGNLRTGSRTKAQYWGGSKRTCFNSRPFLLVSPKPARYCDSRIRSADK